MLANYSSFLLNTAVRTPLQLINPKVTLSTDVTFPKDSVYHYLDTDTEIMFPLVEGVYSLGVPDNKRIPIYNVQELSSLQGNPLIQDKQVPIKTRRWSLENNKKFKVYNLLDDIKQDSQVTTLINYNILKTKYKYVTNPLNKHFKTYNLYHTLFTHVKQSINLNKSVKQIVEFKLPTSLPSYPIVKMLASFSDIKRSKVITDTHFTVIINLFSWLNPVARATTTLSSITEDDTNNITLMFNYKDKLAFVPMSLLAAMLDTSKLESSVKYDYTRVQKLFIAFLHAIQTKVDKDIVVEVTEPLEGVTEPVDTSDEDDEDVPLSKKSDPNVNRLVKPKAKDTEINDLIIHDDDFSSLSSFLDEDQKVVGLVDTDYIKSIEKVTNMVEDVEGVMDVDTITAATFQSTDDDVASILAEDSVEEKNEKSIHELVSLKAISTSEVRNYNKLMVERGNLASPYDNKVKLDDYKVIKEEDLLIKDEDRNLGVTSSMVDASLKESSLNNLSKSYINNVLKKDIVACVANIEKAGLTIREHSVESSSTAMGNYEMHKLVIKPLKGNESTIYFRIPKVNSEGTFVAAGCKYISRSQRGDVPLRKIAYNKVALTSYYSKLFVINTERKAYDTFAYINTYIKEAYFSSETSDIIQEVVLGASYSNTVKLPAILSSLAMVFTKLVINGYTFTLDRKIAVTLLEESAITKLEQQGLYVCGYNSKKVPLLCDMNNVFSVYQGESLGKMQSILNIPSEKLPVSYSELKLLGKNLPLGVVLAYYLGLTDLIKVLKPIIQVIETGKRYTPTDDEYIIRFSDYKLILNRNDKESTLILSGFLYFRDFIKQYSFNDFNNKNIYLNMIEERDFGIWHLKELDILKDLFLDPITTEVLQTIHEPTTYIPLLLRANQLLTTYDYPDINDGSYSRIKGYERIAGLMYRTLTESVRSYKFKNTAKNKLELNPYAVWNAVTQDNTVKIVEETNPVVNLKETEAVTFAGADGLNKDIIASEMRKYSKADMGLISEATVDSSDVSINTFMTPDPKITGVRGIVNKDNKDYKTIPSKLMSTSALLLPGSDHDDPKRIKIE